MGGLGGSVRRPPVASDPIERLYEQPRARFRGRTNLVHNEHAGDTIHNTTPVEVQLLVKITLEEVVSGELLILIARKVSFDGELPGESKGFQLQVGRIREVVFCKGKHVMRTLSIAARSSAVTLNT